jgi:hypothetical protein
MAAKREHLQWKSRTSINKSVFELVRKRLEIYIPSINRQLVRRQGNNKSGWRC